jgi:hypothetical protein
MSPPALTAHPQKRSGLAGRNANPIASAVLIRASASPSSEAIPTTSPFFASKGLP